MAHSIHSLGHSSPLSNFLPDGLTIREGEHRQTFQPLVIMLLLEPLKLQASTFLWHTYGKLAHRAYL